MASEFTGYWRARIQVLEHKNKQLPDIYEILEYFRNNVQLTHVEKTRTTHGAFLATFQDQEQQNGKTADDKDEQKIKPTRPCICEQPHKLRDCWYLFETSRPATWKPNADTQRQVDEKLEKSARLREIVKRIREQATKDKNDKNGTPKANFMVSAFNNGPSDYKLRKSIILDSSATIHVCNDKARFHTFRPVIEEEFLYTGTTMVPIKGYGDVTITVAMPNGPLKVGLIDTAYIPAFHMTVASLSKFVKKGVHLDTENDRLKQNGKTFCMLKWHYNQWTLEFHEPPSIFATTKTDARTTKDIWHQCLGHIGQEAVQYLPGMQRDGTKGPKTIDCETCS
jgi:hypothetical protein